MDLNEPITAVIPSLEGRVLLALARASAPLSGSRVAQLVPGASNPGVRDALRRLARHGTVLAERSSHAILYTANRDHVAWPAIAATVEFATTAHVILRERLVGLVTRHLGLHDSDLTTLALFGSVARGTSDGSSDIDLVLLTPDAAAEVDVEQLVLEATRRVELWTGNPCSIYDLTHARLAEMVHRGDPMIRSWLDDAVTLHGPDLRRLLTAEGVRSRGRGQNDEDDASLGR